MELLNRWTREVIFEFEGAKSILELVVAAVAAKKSLSGANLCGANLRGANLYGADLYGADLRDANLRDANLCGANLRDANLRDANLCGANLCGSNLSGANLYGANLYGAKNAELAIARIQHIPESGAFIGWKKCKNNVIVKLQIPEDAERSHGSERKCRCSKAVVLEIFGATEATSLHDPKFVYRVGETVLPSGWDKDRWNTCGEGIHFYITRLEAENHA